MMELELAVGVEIRCHHAEQKGEGDSLTFSASSMFWDPAILLERPENAAVDARSCRRSGFLAGMSRTAETAPVSLAEHLHLSAGVVDIDGDLVELLDEVLEVLRLELGEVDRYP